MSNKSTTIRQTVESVNKIDLIVKHILTNYKNQAKSPMLVVETNSYLNERIPSKDIDIHLMFYPNNSPLWIFSIVAFSRKNSSKILQSITGDQNVTTAIQTAINPLKEFNNYSMEVNPHALRWTQQAIYRSPKISFKDILSLESYKEKDLEEYEISQIDLDKKIVLEKSICFGLSVFSNKNEKI